MLTFADGELYNPSTLFGKPSRHNILSVGLACLVRILVSMA